LVSGSFPGSNLWTAISGARPVLAEVAGRRCFTFDGRDEKLDTVL
jgi:hypothetical protein